MLSPSFLFIFPTLVTSRLLLQTPSRTSEGVVAAPSSESMPSPTSYPFHHLFVRDQTPLNSGICGYISGYESRPLVCPQNSQCLFDVTVAGCCSSGNARSDCAYSTTCYDSDMAQGLGGTTSSGTSNGDGIRVPLLCTESDSPFCLKYTFTDDDYNSYGIYACTNTSGMTIDMQRSYDTTTTMITTSDQSTSAILLQSQSSIESSPTSSSSCSATATSSNDSVNSVVPVAAPDQTSSSGNGGRIAGGVVGGLAAVALFAVLGVAYRRRKISAATDATVKSFRVLNRQTGDSQDQQNRSSRVDREVVSTDQSVGTATRPKPETAPKQAMTELRSPVYVPYHPPAHQQPYQAPPSKTSVPNRPSYQSFRYEPLRASDGSTSLESLNIPELAARHIKAPALRERQSMSAVSANHSCPQTHHGTANCQSPSRASLPLQGHMTSRFSELEAHSRLELP